MFFFTDEEDRLTELHFDLKNPLSEEMVERANSFKGENFKKFVLFALKNKFFLKTRVRFCLGGNYPTYFWGSRRSVMVYPPPERKEIPKYGRIYLKAANDPSFVSLLWEKRDEDSEYETDVYEFTLDKSKIKEISYSFNIIRNRRNCIYLVDEYNSENPEEDKIKIKSKNEIAFIGIHRENNTMRFFSSEELKWLRLKELSQYGPLKYAEPFDEDLKKKAAKTLIEIRKKKKNNPDLFPRFQDKEENKSVLSKIKNLFR